MNVVSAQKHTLGLSHLLPREAVPLLLADHQGSWLGETLTALP